MSDIISLEEELSAIFDESNYSNESYYHFMDISVEATMEVLLFSEEGLWEDIFGDTPKGNKSARIAAWVITFLLFPIPIVPSSPVATIFVGAALSLFGAHVMSRLVGHLTRTEQERVEDYLEQLTDIRDKFKLSESDSEKLKLIKKAREVVKNCLKYLSKLMIKAEKDYERARLSGDDELEKFYKKKIVKLAQSIKRVSESITEMVKEGEKRR